MTEEEKRERELRWKREYYQRNKERLQREGRERYQRIKGTQLARQNRKYAEDSELREKHRKYVSKRYYTNRDKVLSSIDRERKLNYNKKYYRENREKLLKARKIKYANPVERQKSRARLRVLEALKSGKLIRPDKCANSECGRQCKPDAHHYEGYDVEHSLNVVWLCKSCHKLAEKQGKRHPANS